jgi:hypothetical protein
MEKQPDIKGIIQSHASWLLEQENLDNDYRAEPQTKRTKAFLKHCFKAVREAEDELNIQVAHQKDWSWLFNRRNKRKLERMLKQTRFYDVLCYLTGMATWEQTQAVAAVLTKEGAEVKAQTGKGRTVTRLLVLIRVNVAHAAETLRITERMVRKYLQAFSDKGIIKEHGKAGGRNMSTIYSLGTWQQNGLTRKRLFYLTARRVKNLAEFTVH